MDIWFKAKVDWGEALGLLSDTEAGRFAKALWKYAATGEAGTLTGREQMLFALVLADLRREAEHRERISALRSEAGRRGGRPRAESKTSNGLSPKADESNQSETESRKEKDRTQTKEPEAGCAEGGGAASTPVITLPLNDGSEWPVGADLARQWRELYPAVDVEQALRSMRGWLLANRTRRKTARGIERFAAAWLAREQDRGGTLAVLGRMEALADECAEIEGELRALSARVEGPILALPPGPHRLVMRLRYLEWRAVSDVANGAGYERRYTYKLLEEGERRLAREESAAGGRKEGGARRAEG